MRVILIGLLSSNIVFCQRPARIGPDGKPLLNRPVLDDCKNRISHLEWNDHNYFLSWREPWHKFEDWDWFNGRNFCRDRCMDLISFDTPNEFKLFAAIMQTDNVSSIYTSGRKCNFRGKGCDAEHLQPININGWFWAGSGNKRIPPTNVKHNEAFWSPTGENGFGQPDNAEGLAKGPIETEFDIGVTIEGLQEYHDEACLAVLNNAYGEGIAWHDKACHFRSVIVCEDSDQLMNLVQSQKGVDVTKMVTKSERALNPDEINLNEVETIHDPRKSKKHLQNSVKQPLAQKFPLARPRRPSRPQFQKKPNGFLGALGLKNRFPFLF